MVFFVSLIRTGHVFFSEDAHDINRTILFLQIIRCSTDTNSNIRRHLANVHGKTQLHCNSFRSARLTGVAPERKRSLDEAAIRCVVVDARGFGDFRRSGMQSFLRVAVPGYYGPSSRTVQRHLARFYKKKRIELKEQLASVPSVSLTADLWSSARNQSFLCITAHFIVGEHFDLQSKVLSFRQFRGRHFNARIRAHMHRVLEQFSLVGKVMTTTTDNGSDMRAAASTERLFGVRLHCMAHALNLTVQRGLCLWPKQKKHTWLRQTIKTTIRGNLSSISMKLVEKRCRNV